VVLTIGSVLKISKVITGENHTGNLKPRPEQIGFIHNLLQFIFIYLPGFRTITFCTGEFKGLENSRGKVNLNREVSIFAPRKKY
jgi:hypothetical protein